ncbi:MAG TPA: nucleotide exchange factor GrpE [Pyrinomonadaceae bacterium]|nr:nucleotide exchange factor GrpE [Pyrinomonadaceae bacterium]
MNTNDTLETANDYSDNAQDAASVDDFLRELEHLEEDLHITAELKIEVSDSEFDDSNLPEFIVEDLKPIQPKTHKPVETNVNAAANDRLKREVTQLEAVVAKFKAEREEILERSERQARDFENFKKRTERERYERLSVQMENLAVQMLPVLDNLDRAIDFVTAMSNEKRTEIQPFIDGISLVHRQIDDVLATMGVKPVIAVGQEFDPHFHEAVAIQDSEKYAPNTVCEELLRGYQMGTRVIRHSMVKVSSAALNNPATSADHSSDQSIPN